MAQPEPETPDARGEQPATDLAGSLTFGGDAEVIPGNPCESSDKEDEETR